MEFTLAEKHKHSRRTLFALGFGYLIDQGEAQAMSVLIPIIQSMWGVSFTLIGLMTTLRTITQTISAPLWGFAADRYSRKKVLVIGTGVWGIWTILVGLTPNFSSMLVIRAISGLGLGALMPATFSLIADHYPQSQRGRALGAIGFVGSIGTVVGVISLGFVANPVLWRWGFIGLGIASVLSGALIWLLVKELPRGSAEPELEDIITEQKAGRYTINWPDVFATLRIPTIWAAIAQGVTGTMPWVVLGFYFINWMVTELGFSNEITLTDPRGSAPLVFGVIVAGSAFGNFLGGVIGDFAEKVNPKYGRTAIGQFSVFSGVPLTYILLTRAHLMSFNELLGLSLIISLLITWPGRGAKEPMMQAVVAPEARSSAYAVVNLIEGGLSAFAGVIAGALADRIGFTNALLWTIPFPWIICGIFFSAFYFTYPRDAARVRTVMAARRQELIQNQQNPGRLV
jgi:MFS family permease